MTGLLWCCKDMEQIISCKYDYVRSGRPECTNRESLMCFDDFENLRQFDVDCWVTDDTFDPSVWDNDIPYGIEVTGFIWDGKESLVAKRQEAEQSRKVMVIEVEE